MIFVWLGLFKMMCGILVFFIVCDEIDGYDCMVEGYFVLFLW